MDNLTLEDMIKALKCVSSQDIEDDCYMDRENFKHTQDDNYKPIVCGNGENLKDCISGKEAVGCPYYQQEYGCCFEEGELLWLKNVAELLEELKSYKDAEEQGLLVRLPCKVGDTLFCIIEGTIRELRVQHFDIPAFGTTDIAFRYADGFKLERFIGELGKTVFLTREEAEKKLEEMKNNG